MLNTHVVMEVCSPFDHALHDVSDIRHNHSLPLTSTGVQGADTIVAGIANHLIKVVYRNMKIHIIVYKNHRRVHVNLHVQYCSDTRYNECALQTRLRVQANAFAYSCERISPYTKVRV